MCDGSVASVKKTAWKPLFAAAVAGLVLSGCATGGTAAVVGDVKITESDVDRTLAACEEAGVPLIETGAGSRGAVAFSLAAGEAARQDPALKDLLPTEEAIQEALATLPPAVLESKECLPYFTGTLQFNTAFNEVEMRTPDKLDAMLANTLGLIELNPRHGRFTTDETGAIRLGSGSMSKETVTAFFAEE